MRKPGLLLIILICSCSPSFQKIKSELAQNPASGKYLDVPFIAQQDLYCGPATLAMAANFYGCALSQDEIAQKYFDPDVGGLFTLDMIAAAKELGFEVEHGSGAWEQLKKDIDRGEPVIVFWNYLPEPLPGRHFAVAIGYFSDKDREWLVVHSGKKQNQVMARKKFEDFWRIEDRWMMTIKPGPNACKWRSAKQISQSQKPPLVCSCRSLEG